MSGTPPTTTTSSTTTDAPIVYPHLGTLLVGTGLGVTTFTAAAGDTIPMSIRGILAGLGAAASAVGLFLLGRASV